MLIAVAVTLFLGFFLLVAIAQALERGRVARAMAEAEGLPAGASDRKALDAWKGALIAAVRPDQMRRALGELRAIYQRANSAEGLRVMERLDRLYHDWLEMHELSEKVEASGRGRRMKESLMHEIQRTRRELPNLPGPA